MAKDSNIVMEGVVLDNMGGDVFSVNVNGNTLKCKLGGKLRRNKIRIVAGDKVDIEMSPYGDANSMGFICKRK
jgi:translation initiation factor IF-1